VEELGKVDPDQLRRQVDQIDWYHRISLGHGIVTPGTHGFQSGRLPDDLSGKTVLDVGAWDGLYSFEAERRGAERVMATDSFCWSGPGWGTKAGFELARRAMDSNVEDREVDVLDLSPETVGEWDVVLFLSVLYHMRHPLLALERVASVTRELLVLGTLVDMRLLRRPAAAFYPDSEVDRDPTNWWGPNKAAVEAMLRTVGFRDVQIKHDHSPAREYRASWFRRRITDRLSGRREGHHRIVVHATK
jgi:tRNA (mo5U34)-methyltransferase